MGENATVSFMTNVVKTAVLGVLSGKKTMFQLKYLKYTVLCDKFADTQISKLSTMSSPTFSPV